MGKLKPCGPLGAFWEEQAMSRHWVSSSPFLSSSSHTTQTLHYRNRYTYSHPNLNFLPYTIQILVPHVVVCPSGAWFENRPYSMPSIRLVRNPKRVIVQWVGIGTHIWLILLFKSVDHLFGIVVSMFDCHPRGPEFDSWLYSRNFSRSIGSGSGSTQPHEANWVAAWYEK